MGSRNDLRFNSDPRRKQELQARPLIDDIYRGVFGSIRILRDDKEWLVLDKKFAIDTIITLNTGQILTVQEKALSYEYYGYRSLTVEYKQNQHTGEEGDWFRLASQLYFVGYLSEDSSEFVEWVLVDTARLALNTARGKMPWYDNANRDGRARASFKYICFDDIPNECFIARSIKPSESFLRKDTP